MPLLKYTEVSVLDVPEEEFDASTGYGVIFVSGIYDDASESWTYCASTSTDYGMPPAPYVAFGRVSVEGTSSQAAETNIAVIGWVCESTIKQGRTVDVIDLYGDRDKAAVILGIRPIESGYISASVEDWAQEVAEQHQHMLRVLVEES